MNAPVDLSIAVVNFNSAHFLPPLLESIATQEWTVDGRPGTWELIVVDNASKGEDAAILAELKSDRVRVVQNTMNTGYGQANNQAYALARGRFHMILNPDTRFLPGCLHELVSVLVERSEAAVVGPLAYMDPMAQCMMPPNEVPTPELFERQTQGQTDVAVARDHLDERTRAAWRYWLATEPMEMGMLSGSCLVFRRELFAREYPFDPGYPLYYEDTDLFMRLTRRGQKLFHVPTAKMLHYWSQSADSHARGAEYRHEISARRYYEKYWGRDGVDRYELNRARAVRTKEEGTHVSPFDFEPLEAGAESPVFPVDPGAGRFYVEFAGNPIFTLAVGMILDGDGDVTVSQVMWDQLGPGKYWIRVIDPETLETAKGWVITKRAS